MLFGFRPIVAAMRPSVGRHGFTLGTKSPQVHPHCPHPRLRNVAIALVLATQTAACVRCAPGQVSTGVSRLTMLNLATLVEYLNTEGPCGFESPEIKSMVEFSGPVGSMGTGTWRIENCEIDLPRSDPYISEDCNGVETRAFGKVTVTAERRISGILADDDENPVIPGGPDSVTIEIIRADFSNFRTELSNNDNAMTWIKGSISGSVTPRLAVDDDLGACSVVTSNALLSDVRYGSNTLVYVDTPDRSFDVDVGGSELFAVNGLYADRENDLWGSIDVWGGTYQVPDDGLGLDPDYNPDLFGTSYLCKSGLAQPITYDCGSFIQPILAQNAARISMRLIGRVASLLEDDTQCGFSSPEVLAGGVFDAPTGDIGSATFRVDRCVLDLPENTVVTTACDGSEGYGRGRLVVSATKRMEGRLTGDLLTPVVPMNDNPVIFDLAVEEFEEFEIAESGTAIRVHRGGMSGRVEPRVAADSADSGACSFVSDVVRFSNVRWRPSDITLRADEGTFTTSIEDSQLQAVNGYWGGDENTLRGSIVLEDEPYQLPTDPADDGLDPEYDRASFDSAWQCGTLERPVRFDCAFNDPLAQGAAQLGVQTFGMVATLIEGDERCGFSSPQVMSRVAIDGPVGFPDATAVFTIDRSCELSFPQPKVIDTDCNGIRTFAQGTVRVAGTFTLNGIASGDPAEPIVPTSREPAALELTASYEDFAIWTDPGTNILTIRSGQQSGTVAPRVGIDDATGACSITTPVAQIRDLRYIQAPVTVEQDGRQFNVVIDSAELDATNGRTETATNRLTGRLEHGWG